MPELNINDEKMVKKYNDFVENSSFGRYFQHVNWSKVKSNWESYYLYKVNENNEIIATMLILSIQNEDGNTFMYSPRGPVCDIYNIELFKTLIDEAKILAKAKNAFLLRIDPEIEYDDVLEALLLKNGIFLRTCDIPSKILTSNPAFNLVLPLNDIKKFDDPINYFSSKLRNTIRRTYRDGLNTRIIDINSGNYEKALDNLFNMVKNVSTKKNIGYRSKEYLDSILRNFDDAKIFETYNKDQEVLSSCLILTFNKKTYYLYSGRSNFSSRLSASYQMNYEAILYAISKKSKYYDFGAVFSLDNSCDLYTFKHKFCKKQEVTRYIGEIDIIFNKEVYQKFNMKKINN